MSLLRALFLVSIAVSLGACSNGSDSNRGDSGETVLTGQLIDSAIGGVRYTTETLSGVTDNQGKFEYLQGETVRFYLGDLMLGDARGAAIVNLFDLVDGVSPAAGIALKKVIGERPQGPSFHTVINLATLLQTLDKDGNPENGIEISPDVAALFSPNSIDFNQHWQDFSYDHSVIEAMVEAKVRNVLDSARQLRKPWQATAHLYKSLGIDSNLRVANGESTPDFISNYVFDDEGKLTHLEYDRGANGTQDEVTVYTYDGAGNRIRLEQFTGGGDKPDYVADYTYDPAGNQIGRTVAFKGNTLTAETSTYNYDANGNRTREQSNTSGDDMPNRISNFTYDADDNLTRTVQDDNGDDQPDIIYTYLYDPAGNRVRAELDDTHDNTADTITTNEYDADGYLIRSEQVDTVGKTKRVSTYEYANGKQIRAEHVYQGNGSADQTIVSAYDADGNLQRVEFYTNGNNKPDQIHTTVYGADGYAVRREEYSDANSEPDRIVTVNYAVNADGWWSAFNVDGMLDAVGTNAKLASSTSSASTVAFAATNNTHTDGG